MRATIVRIGQLFSRPVGVIPLLAVPLVAGGLYGLAADVGEVPAGDYRAAPAASVTTNSDPAAAARAALDRAEIPLGLLESGFDKLNDGAAQLNDGAGEMASGLDRAAAGGTELSNGITRLDNGLGEIGDGSARLNDGVSALVDALSGVAAVQGQVVQILTDSIDDLSTVDDEAARRAVDQLTALRDVVQANGMQDLPARLEELRAGSQELTYQLDDPSSPFAGGLRRATDGAAQLRDGLVALDDGGRRLTDGTNELVTRVDPVDGVLASLSSAIDDARAALPADDSAGSQPASAPAAVVSRALAPGFPIAVLILIGATLAAASGSRTGTRALLPAALTAVCGWITLIGSGWATTPAALATAAGVIVLATAAITAATAALIAAVGRTRGRWIAAILVLVQVLIAAIAAAGDDRAAGIMSLFTPIGWLIAGLSAVAAQAPMHDLAVPVLVFGTALAIGLSILAAARSGTAADDEDQAAPADSEADPTPAPIDATDDADDADDLDTTAADAVALVSAGRAPDSAAEPATTSTDRVDSNSVEPV
ncbi:hypothetical protein [Millisia brevis]|uniref:hypothetical protein n=1 Tax=Millisia brevis TaxID=264148 RepID=UPI00082F47D4|nr:hypothetical protein [Millisia brevis]